MQKRYYKLVAGTRRIAFSLNIALAILIALVFAKGVIASLPVGPGKVGNDY